MKIFHDFENGLSLSSLLSTIYNIDTKIKYILMCLLVLFTDLVTHKEPAMPRSQSPEHSPQCPSEDEGKEERNWREEAKEEEEEEAKLKDTLKNEEEHEELCPRKRPVSKSLMDTLWAKFKLNTCPTVQDRLSLSFEFSMTDKQV